MSSAVHFARKETTEIVRTWRIYVLPSIFLLFALTGPLLAKYTPELVTSIAGSGFEGLKFPTPTPLDSYAQWIKNLSQIGLFALIIIYGGLVSSERRSGTAVLVLTKPLSRMSFVLVKATVQLVFVSLLLLLGTAITWAMTAIVFGSAPAGPLWASAGALWALAALYLCAMTFFSVLIPSAAGAAGAGLGLYLALSVGGIWTPLASHSPAGLMGAASTLAAGGHTGSLVWPLVTAVACCLLLLGAAAWLFRRQEL